MFRLLFFVLVGYLVYRGLKTLFVPRHDHPEIKGKPKSKQHPSIDRSNIEDAYFKDIED